MTIASDVTPHPLMHMQLIRTQTEISRFLSVEICAVFWLRHLSKIEIETLLLLYDLQKAHIRIR